MTDRARAFIQRWASDNVRGEVSLPQNSGPRAETLAKKCFTAAAGAGIPAAEISPGAVESLRAFMMTVIEDANDREIEGLLANWRQVS